MIKNNKIIYFEEVGYEWQSSLDGRPFIGNYKSEECRHDELEHCNLCYYFSAECQLYIVKDVNVKDGELTGKGYFYNARVGYDRSKNTIWTTDNCRTSSKEISLEPKEHIVAWRFLEFDDLIKLQNKYFKDFLINTF